MIIFNSLKEVIEFAHDLVINHSVKDLRKINPTTIIDFTVGAKYHLAKVTREFANRLDLGNVGTIFEWTYYHRKYLACCRIDPRLIIYCSNLIMMWTYDTLLEVIVHELTHLQVRRHNCKFWNLLFNNLKRLGIVDMSIPFNSFFVRRYDKTNYRTMRKTDILYYSVFWQQSFYTPYEDSKIKDAVAALRSNKIFDIQASRRYMLRCPKERYFEYIDSVENAYSNYERVTFIQNNSGQNIYDSFRTDKIHLSCSTR